MRISSPKGPRRRTGHDVRGGSRRHPPFVYSAAETRVVVLTDTLELSNIAEIESAVAPIDGQSSRRVVIDLTAVELIANDELAAFAGMLRRLLRKDTSVAVAGSDPRTQSLLRELDLDGLLLTPTIHLALASVESTPSMGTGAADRKNLSASEASLPDESRNQRIRI